MLNRCFCWFEIWLSIDCHFSHTTAIPTYLGAKTHFCCLYTTSKCTIQKSTRIQEACVNVKGTCILEKVQLFVAHLLMDALFGIIIIIFIISFITDKYLFCFVLLGSCRVLNDMLCWTIWAQVQRRSISSFCVPACTLRYTLQEYGLLLSLSLMFS